MDRITERIRRTMASTIQALEPHDGLAIEWDASLVAKASIFRGQISHDPAIAFLLTVAERDTGQTATTSYIADVAYCGDHFVIQTTLDLWYRVIFNLSLMSSGFDEVYEDVLEQEG